ncbi:inner nuclear membrane protein Man1 [Danaus plexippus plexippus]|uniref:LEM domain-containing protein 2 n=1 Tax=Danaus plexippus plexippus TaxID=278856 RepID=A0A212ELG8_DANPL|nr:inner nuclear membrane protein Man1 [Danaus plexippus plexippus]
MADQVDTMSDAELRTKLAEHGFPIMPITASTRKLLVKKLKMVLDNKTKPRNSVDKVESRRSLARYSSGEESDLDSSNISKEKRSRRVTTGGAMLPPVTNKSRRIPLKRDSPIKRDIDKGSESEDEKSPVRTHEEVETVTTRRVTRTYAANDQDDYETGSDSDVDGEKKTSSPLRSSSRSSDYISSTLPSNDPSPSPPRSSLFSRPTLSNTNFSSSLSSSDHLNSIRSRLGLTSSLADRPSGSSFTSNYTSSAFQPSTSTIDEVESPYLSNFTRRLSSLKAEPPKPSTFLDRDTTNGSPLIPRRSFISGVPRSEIIDYKASYDKKFLKNNLVSLALVALVSLFFFCLVFMYIVKKNDITSVVDDQDSVIPICQLDLLRNRPGINCVPREQVSYAKQLLEIIHPKLTERAAEYKCGKSGAVPYVTEREIIDLARPRVDINQCRTDLNNLEVLLVTNPRWGFNVVQTENLYSTDVIYLPLTNVDMLVQQRNKGGLALALSDPSTPISCLFVNTLYSAGTTIAIIGILSVLLLGLQRFYKYYIHCQKKKSEEIYSMVEQIIDVISQETEDSGEPYISVDHVRDTLISPQNREKMSSVWDAAVKFIQKNESRVRMEVQSVDGEDCRVWRWIASHNSPKRSTSWQGQAFVTQEGSVNNLTVSPTPCLKIRNMFDKNDTNPNLRTVIQDVILEKCERSNILHIDIESASCCVYVKCATPADAGIVYKNLHGWWYEGRLITVKYLRLERYMQRFPGSPSSGFYLKPSRLRRTWDE